MRSITEEAYDVTAANPTRKKRDRRSRTSPSRFRFGLGRRLGHGRKHRPELFDGALQLVRRSDFGVPRHPRDGKINGGGDLDGGFPAASHEQDGTDGTPSDGRHEAIAFDDAAKAREALSVRVDHLRRGPAVHLVRRLGGLLDDAQKARAARMLSHHLLQPGSLPLERVFVHGAPPNHDANRPRFSDRERFVAVDHPKSGIERPRKGASHRGS
jgi:hypothetical protein